MVPVFALQAAINGIKEITRRELAVYDADGRALAYTDGYGPTHFPAAGDFLRESEDAGAGESAGRLIAGGYYVKARDGGAVKYVAAARGEDEEARQSARLAALHAESLDAAYRERADRDSFIKSLLLDNLLLVDIYSRARKLHVENGARRVVYLIETDADGDTGAAEVVRGVFPSKHRDFVTAVDERSIILVKELREKEGRTQIEQYARVICDTLAGEAMTRVCVAIGTTVTDLKNVSASFKEARMAREVGRIFEADKQIVNYEQLGVGRLIYQLPVPLCRMFLSEVLNGRALSDYDGETLHTAQKFFENGLNISETARALFVHRNTLVYRLDKLQKQTGLDLRRFEDAVVFKITMMVSKYMMFKEGQIFQ